MTARFGSRLVLLFATTVALSSVSVTRADPTPADVLLNAADLLARQFNYRDALATYVRAESVANPAQRVRAGIGITLSAVRVGEFEFAYSKAVELKDANRDDALVRSVYGQAAWSAGLFDEAEASFAEVLWNRPDERAARVGMARVLLARGRPSEALEQALIATARGADGDTCSVLGAIYKRLGQLDQSIAWYTRYLALVANSDADTRLSTEGEIVYLKSFGKRAPGRIENRGRGIVHSIPFSLDKDKVVVRGLLNGTEWIDLSVDTGAEQTILSERTARRLGVVPISATITAGVGEVGLRRLQHGTISALQVGSLLVRDVPCLIATPSLSSSGYEEREAFSPLALGLSASIDYRRKEMKLAEDIGAGDYTFALPMWFSRLATVRGLVNRERSTSFIVDTGGQALSISTDTARMLSSQPRLRRIPLNVIGTSGRDPDAYLQPGLSLAFAAISLENYPVVVMNLRGPSILLGYRVGGILGYHFLGNYRVTFDVRRGVLGLSSPTTP